MAIDRAGDDSGLCAGPTPKSRKPLASRPRPAPTRPTSPRRRQRLRWPRTGRSPTRPRSSSPRPSARRISRTSRSASIAIGARRLDQLNISNFEQYTKQLPSVSFQIGAARRHRGLHARRRDRRRRQPLGIAAIGRHLSRRAAGDDHRRDARRPHLRHRPDRKPRRSAGHALRRLERSRDDPDHHQQARARA